jgi:short subunit dehydrogenase-like uncharacterized protein
MTTWMIYGANGYSGELIARAAAASGLRPVLAGRRADRILPLANALGLAHRTFPADAPLLDGIGLVLNCAGPFSATARPMMRAAIAARAHYLDITGEIDVFEHARSLDTAARAAGVVLCPGVGFDVIGTDCVALRLKQAVPDATELALGFESASRRSPGTAKTMVEGMGRGTLIRRGGTIRSEPLGWRSRRIDFGNGERLAIAFPWGDVSTAYTTTGIPDITVFVAVTPAMRRSALVANLAMPLLRIGAVQARLKARAAATVGPDATKRSRAPTFVWGEVRNGSGVARTARIRTANGYDVTIHGALAVVQHVIGANTLVPGNTTPSLLCGADLIERLPGSGTLTLS